MDAKTIGPLALTGPYSQAETARLLACSQRVVQRLVETGKLRTVRVKGRWMVPASEITRLASSPPAAPAPPTERYPSFSAPEETSAFILEHVPAAEPWWHLWRADVEAMFFAREVAKMLPDEKGEPNARADRLLLEHADAERTAALGYLSELIAAEVNAARDISARVVPPETVERLQARRARLAELIAEVQRATEPKPTTEPKP